MNDCRDKNDLDQMPDICWVIALKSEASPIISEFKMSLLSNESLFPIYTNRKLRHALIISGIGQINAAAATAYLASRCHAQKWTAWINIGIAGYSEELVGEIFQAIKVTNFANSRSFFPGYRFTNLYPDNSIQIELNSQGVISTRHPQVEDFPSESQFTTRDLPSHSAILQCNQFLDDIMWFDLLTNMNSSMLLQKCLWRIQSING